MIGKNIKFQFLVVINNKYFSNGSCHLDKASNVEIGVECQIFVIAIFFN